MIRVQHEDFDHSQEYEALKYAADGDGALVTFTGLVRDMCEVGSVISMQLEHYPGMTEKALMCICKEARKRWPLGNIRIVHRIGLLSAGEQIVFIGVSSKHRHHAFAAVEFIIDYLKTKAPFWKKENTAVGQIWVAPDENDQRAVVRWLADEP